MTSRTQTLVLGFFGFVFITLVAILVAAPAVYDQALQLPPDNRLAEAGFLAALTAFLVLLSVGVLRRWRWTFWLILIAFLFGVLRVPTSALQLSGTLPAATPTWYIGFQGLLGLVQVAIGIIMFREYRGAGAWGATTAR
jgi:hypothetical protein